MIDEPNTIVRSDHRSWPPVRVEIPDDVNPFLLVLFFAHAGDDAPFVGFEVVPSDRAAGLDPGSFDRLARGLPMYVEYARATMELKRGDQMRAIELLRTGRSVRSRGMPDTFYKAIAAEYEALVRARDPHPIKTIAAARPVHKSRASRWVTKARELGYINEQNGDA